MNECKCNCDCHDEYQLELVDVGQYQGELARLGLAFREAIIHFPERREEFFMLFATKAMEIGKTADIYKKYTKKLRKRLWTNAIHRSKDDPVVK